MGILPFLRQHILPVVLAVGAVPLWALDMIGRYEEVMGMPGWVWQASAGALVLLAVFVFFYQVHRRLEATPVSPASPPQGHFLEIDPPRLEQIYEGAHETLMHFVVRDLFGACFAREQVHNALIRALCPNGPIAQLAVLGAAHHSNAHIYHLGRRGLEGLINNPPEYIPLQKMITSVAWVEDGYNDFLQEAVRLAQTGYITQEAANRIAKLWEDWRHAHNAMVAAYEPVKRDSRMGELFRPARESRWGGIIPPPTGAIPIPLMLREP